MSISPSERELVAQALQQHRVLGRLDGAAREALLPRLQLQHWARHQTVATGPTLTQQLCLLISGELVFQPEAPDEETPPLPMTAPDWFGAGVQAPGQGGWQVVAMAPSLVATLGLEELTALLQAQPWLQLFMQPVVTQAPPLEAADPHLNLMTTPVRALVQRAPVTVSPHTPIRAVAELMREQRVSSVILVEQGHLFGLVTDRDLRNRALATGLDPAQPVLEIATVAPMTIDINAPGFDALLLMARHNIHHVPVMDGNQVAGMVTATDVTEQHSTSAVFLAGDIHKQTGLEGLIAAAGKVKQLQKHLAAAGASAFSTGHIVTAITDALTTRLLHLAEMQLGPAPVDFAWVAAGSQARHEQTAKSDQDNCMVLDDAYDPAVHGDYFKQLATFVCDGLAACGYVHCPGEMMAMTDPWRQPRRHWAELFRRWVDTPEPMALMLTCVFFDVRVVAGRAELLDGLRQQTLQRTRGNGLFLAHLVGNALSRQPPLGLFGGLSTLRSGDHKGALDLKHTGIVPIIDLARVYALAAGHPAVNTHERLAHAAESGEISAQGVRDLRDALEHLSMVRIRHQSRRIAAGFEADNFLRPDELSNFERSQLKDAFGVVKSLQEVLGQRYRMAR
jgi:CBS domain-containing protein